MKLYVAVYVRGARVSIDITSILSKQIGVSAKDLRVEWGNSQRVSRSKVLSREKRMQEVIIGLVSW